MDVQEYMRQVEQALGDLDALRRLRRSATKDEDLGDTQRVQVLGRIDRYIGDEARASATDEDGEPPLHGEGGDSRS